jgi:transcriptional regulator with XRE-family HTH domain
MRKPTGCLWKRPIHGQTVYLAGVAINVSEIARLKNMDQAYVSRIVSGKQQPSLKAARAISEALGMTIDQLLTNIQVKVSERGQKTI